MSNKIKPVQWTQDGYPVFTDPAQFQTWEKQRREEIIDEIQDAFNDKAYDTMVQLYGAEVKRLGEAIEELEKKVDQIMMDINPIINNPVVLVKNKSNCTEEDHHPANERCAKCGVRFR